MTPTDKSNADLQILVPSQNDNPINRNEVLGAIAWLWMHSPLHQEWPSALMRINVLPAIVHRQFLLIRNKQGLPVHYVSWAYFDEERERKYLRNTNSIAFDDWNCGDRMWFIDWIAPHGGSRLLIDKLRREIFPDKAAWALRVKKNSTKGVIQDHFGIHLSDQQKKDYTNQLQRNLDFMNKTSN
jgi:cytolysin-activating lysine-acyltransferase